MEDIDYFDMNPDLRPRAYLVRLASPPTAAPGRPRLHKVVCALPCAIPKAINFSPLRPNSLPQQGRSFMSGVLEYGRVPFLTERALREHKVFEQADDRFRSAVRARQALLREQKGWDIGLYPPTAETQREIGSYLGKTDPDANFITPEVAQLVRREVAY